MKCVGKHKNERHILRDEMVWKKEAKVDRLPRDKYSVFDMYKSLETYV